MKTLTQIREDAARRFSEVGFPTTRNEEWRFTNVTPIARTKFTDAPESAEEWMPEGFGFDAIRLVFVNGRYVPGLSSRKFPSGVTASSLRAANGAAERRLARYAAYQGNPFVALNTARYTDGAYVEVAGRVELSEPIHLVFLTSGAGEPVACHPRALAVIGEGAQATVIESYFGRGSGYLTNAVTEIVAGDRAVVDHYKVQSEDEGAYHVATIQAELGRDANLATYSFSFGARLTRNDVTAVLAEGSEATVDGLYIAKDTQHVDHHTVVDHAQPHGVSRELYKGILADRSSAVFNGRILVRQDAQKTDSKQSNKNLLLSEDAQINTKPELQIFADDVRCTHGATIGQLDRDAIFYLESRGIGGDEARRLLIQAFAREIVDRVKVEPLRARLDQEIWERLDDRRN